MPPSHRALKVAAVSGLAVVLAGSGVARAETLLDAIDLAYKTNPQLQAQRAALRSLDETYVQAEATLRPTLSGGGGYSFTHLSENTESLGAPGAFETNARTASVTLSAPVYTGGAATRAIQAAGRDVLQGRQQLRAIEAQVMTQVVTAYMDVIRDTEALRINVENLKVLQRQLQETSAEFDVGEVTKTDLAQAEARLATAQSNVSQSQSQLEISRANYAQAVGQAPGDLAPPPILPGVPPTFDSALDVGQKENPNLLAAQYGEEATHMRVAEARAAYRPTAQISASYQFQYEPITLSESNGFGGFVAIPLNPYQRTYQAGVQVTVPLFSGGQRGSRVRQALANDNQAMYTIEGQRRSVLQEISQFWAAMVSDHAQTLANEQAVKAAAVAAEGQRQEAQVGLRTTIDVLNAEEEQRTAELQLVVSRHDEYVAAANLLADMGRLEIRYLNADLPPYNPERNFDQVRGKGWTPIDPIVFLLDGVGKPVTGPAQQTSSAPVDSELLSRGPGAPKPSEP
jgi:outer membrane protein